MAPRFSFSGDRLTPIVPTTEPETARAGDTWKWTKSLADYPVSEGWTLTYSFRGASVLADVDVVVVPGTNAYAVSVLPAKTAPLIPGAYSWAAFVTKAGERYTADEGILVIERNLSTAAAGDALSHAEKALPIIEAALSGRLTADIENYQINGKAVAKIPILELKRLRSQYRTEIWRARNGNKLGPTLHTTFGRATT